MNRFPDFIEDIFQEVEGDNKSHDVSVFSLSTCQWCKKGKEWLRKREYAFKYLDIDNINLKEKEQLKSNLRTVFNTRLSFPFLVVDKSVFYSGFNPLEWETMLS